MYKALGAARAMRGKESHERRRLYFAEQGGASGWKKSNLKFAIGNPFLAGSRGSDRRHDGMNTMPGGIVIKAAITKWASQIVSLERESLKDAGMYIGILERLFVFTFVVTGNWEAIGFLIAAKSVFRFGDLTNAKDRKLTEYILTGTLISFGMAMLSGILYLKYIGA